MLTVDVRIHWKCLICITSICLTSSLSGYVLCISYQSFVLSALYIAGIVVKLSYYIHCYYGYLCPVLKFSTCDTSVTCLHGRPKYTPTFDCGNHFGCIFIV